MNINRENIDELNAVLRIKLEKDDYEERVTNILKDYKKRVRLDGFRPGKVPFGLVSKMYRTPVLVEEVNKIVSESISKYLVDEKLNILGEPLPHEEEGKKIDWENDPEFEFAFDLGIAPDLDFAISKKDKVSLYKIKTDDKLREKYIENYKSRLGSMKETDVIKDTEMVKADIIELDESGQPLEEGINVEDGTFSVERIKDEKIRRKFAGKKVGDVVVLDIKKAFPNDAEISGLLKIDKSRINEIKNEFQVTVKTISNYEKAENNKEMWDKIYGPDVVKTEEEFHLKLDEEMKTGTRNDSEYRFRIDIKDTLTKKFRHDLPVEFLKRWLIAVNKDKFTSEEIEKDFDHFIEDLKWQLIKDKIVKDNHIHVSDEEITNFAKGYAQAQFAQYGMANLPEEHLINYANEILKKDDERRKMIEKLYEDKVIDFVKEEVKIEEKDISIEKFNKLFEK